MDNSQSRIAGLFAAKLQQELKKIKSVEDIAKIDLHVPEFEETLLIANLLGRLDEKEIQLLEAEFNEGIPKETNPFEIKFEEAIKYFNNKRPELIENLDEITDEVKANYFWLKKSTNLTVTSKLFKDLGSNLENGGTFKGWLKDIESTIKKEGLSDSGWYWENVYRNAKMGAYSAGHWQQQQDSKEDFPYLQYDGIRDGREQEHTIKFDGLIFPVDHEFWLRYYPPNWYFCRCGTIALTREEMQEEDLKVSRYTKSLKSVKLGSWEGNPGVNYLDSLKKNCDEKEKKLDDLMKTVENADKWYYSPKFDSIIKKKDITNKERRELLKELSYKISPDPVTIEVRKHTANGWNSVRCSKTDENALIKIVKLGVRSDDQRPYQYKVKTIFHELTHYRNQGTRQSGPLFHQYGLYKQDAMYNLEEVFAETVGHYLTRSVGIDDIIIPAYNKDIMRSLPALKQLDEFKDCINIEDFGKIISENYLSKGVEGVKELTNKCIKTRFNLNKYIDNRMEDLKENKTKVAKELGILFDIDPQYLEMDIDEFINSGDSKHKQFFITGLFAVKGV